MNADTQTLQTVDANANRAREGIRVCEDIARFILNLPEWAKNLKALRHKVTKAVALCVESDAQLLSARNTQKDPGKPATYDVRQTNLSIRTILTKNLHRAQEASRVLEELSPLLGAPESTAEFKDIRFALYDAEKHLIEQVD